MPTSSPTQEPPAPGVSSPHAPAASKSQDLPSVRTDLPADEILRKLDAAARRGKLAGFTQGKGQGPLFTVRDVGAPFDGEVVATLGGGTLTFEERVFPKMPAIFLALLVLSVWPGVWLMQSLMNVYFPSVADYTWWWYVPLTVITGPPAYFAAQKKSRQTLHEDAIKVVESVEKALR